MQLLKGNTNILDIGVLDHPFDSLSFPLIFNPLQVREKSKVPPNDVGASLACHAYRGIENRFNAKLMPLLLKEVMDKKNMLLKEFS